MNNEVSNGTPLIADTPIHGALGEYAIIRDVGHEQPAQRVGDRLPFFALDVADRRYAVLFAPSEEELPLGRHVHPHQYQVVATNRTLEEAAAILRYDNELGQNAQQSHQHFFSIHWHQPYLASVALRAAVDDGAGVLLTRAPTVSPNAVIGAAMQQAFRRALAEAEGREASPSPGFRSPITGQTDLVALTGSLYQRSPSTNGRAADFSHVDVLRPLLAEAPGLHRTGAVISNLSEWRARRAPVEHPTPSP